LNKNILLGAFALLLTLTALVPASACTIYKGARYDGGDGWVCQDSWSMCGGTAGGVFTVCVS